MTNKRNWWNNNYDKLVWIVVFIVTVAIGLGRLESELISKISIQQARSISEEEIKDHAPTKEAFQEVREWMIEQRTEMKQLVKNVDWLVRRERERKK